MNDDRISEVYKGEIWTPASQERARRRINWLCSQVSGQSVLDLGCSQGIATILLAREGYDVSGVDIQSSAIAYAQADLARETSSVRDRARFLVAEATDLPWPDGTFDTVLLGELLEHLLAPEQVLAEVARVLSANGLVALTTPFGYHPHHDHRQTFFAPDLVELISKQFAIEVADIQEGYFRIVARRGSDADVNAVIRGLDPAVNAAVYSLQEELIAARRAIQANNRDLRMAAGSDHGLADTSDSLDAEARETQGKAERSVRLWTKERARLTEHLLKVQSELNMARRQLYVTTQTTAEREARSRERFQRRLTKLRYQRDVARWRLESMRQRKWWRIGVALRSLRRQPLRVLSVSLEVLRIFSGRSNAVAKPPMPVEPVGQDPTSPRVSTTDPSRPGVDCPQAPARLLAVATLLDAEAEHRFSFEWVSQPVTANDWEDVLRNGAPDLLFVSDSGCRRPHHDMPVESIVRMVRGFKAAGVPTIYWDTRLIDGSQVHRTLADVFDVIVCSFSVTRERYRSFTQNNNVHLFGPAAQTRLFSPALAHERDGDILSLRSLAVLNGEGALGRAARKIAPDGFAVEGPGARTTETSGSDSPAIRARHYKTAIVEFAGSTDEQEIRRILEVVATKTPIVAKGEVPEELAEMVVSTSTLSTASDAVRALLASEEFRGRISHRAWRHVHQHNSIRQRTDDLLEWAGIGHPQPSPRLTFMIPTNRPHHLEAILDNLGRQTYSAISALLVLHGVEIDVGRMREMAVERGLRDIEILRVPGEVALGDVFNRGFEACEGEFVGKMDDDDFYGSNYASDLVAAFEHTTADIVGKWTHYAYSEALGATVLRYPGREHSYQPLLAISTLIMRKPVLEAHSFLPMPKGSGSQFLREAGANGVRIYAGDRYNYLYNRYSGQGHQHTWPVDEYEFAARAQFICQGRNLAAIEA